MFAIAFPSINPTLVTFGPFAIRWYALAYIAGILIGWRYALHLIQTSPAKIERLAIDDFLLWATLGIVLGGRIGYVLFYNFDYYSAHPLRVFEVWHGGMSFHGGMLGVALAIIVFARQRDIPLLALSDIVACVTPIGLFLGRLANFVNGELYGRVSHLPWAVIFPTVLRNDPAKAREALAATMKVDPHLDTVQRIIAAYGTNPKVHAILNGILQPRHPSQIYEALLEGIVLFTVLWAVWRFTGVRKRPGAVAGVFLIGYGLSRIFVEFFREPDPQLGFLLGGVTMGQILSVPMVLAGIALFVWAKPFVKKDARPGQQKTSKKDA